MKCYYYNEKKGKIQLPLSFVHVIVQNLASNEVQMAYTKSNTYLL